MVAMSMAAEILVDCGKSVRQKLPQTDVIYRSKMLRNPAWRTTPAIVCPIVGAKYHEIVMILAM
jgi:hypothetical protein